MIKLIYFALGVMILCSCGSKKTSDTDSDSIIAGEEIVEVMETDSVSPVAYITRDSIGSIHIGMPMKEIPDSVPGLYNKKVNGASQDAVTVEFSNEKGESFVAFDFGENKIDVLNLIGNYVKVKAPRGDFSLGDKFSRVLELPGVKAEWAGYDDTGMWYWTWEGLWFAPSQENLSETLTRRLYHSDMPPTVADFNEEVTIGFIGTGLPF
ncbi:MAG: hypothetical protein K2J82_02235 [Muribaculaceae bacterium]|nr:hypothetical protein [Muribaculaceae bacterium]MDE6753411.1 hypothetical protein [Muribaculaceae bacterium]